MRGLNPIPDDPRLANAITQQELFTVLHEQPELLRQIPWTSTKERRGVIATNELERQALINDFEFHGIPIQMRLVSVAALQEIRRDPTLTELRVIGPGRMAWAMPGARIPDEEYVITDKWQDFPAFFANVLNHKAAEDPLFGADWTRMIRTRSTSDNGDEAVTHRPEPHPARRLLEWRTNAERVQGETASGLIVPPTTPNFFEDGDDDEPASALTAVARKRR